jgi:hypothetical protein
MSIQGSLENLMKVFLTFYIGCCLVGRPDYPMKLVTQLRVKALEGANSKRFGCPSLFHREGDCMTYVPSRYK